jgi:glycosyltransferase involved in cell wall biosynthesis
MSASSPETPVKVLQILNKLMPSGAEVMLRSAKPHFDLANIQCDILSTGEDEEGPYADELRAAGYRVLYSPMRKRVGFFLGIRHLVKENGYDVVHVHTEQATIWYLLSAAGLAGLARTVHNVFAFRGQLRLRRIFSRWLARVIGVHQLSVGPSVQENELATFGNQTTLCMNWYDDQKVRVPSASEREEARRGLGLEPEQICFVTIANCAPWKNHDGLIRALDQIKDDPRWVYLHVGAEETGYPEQMLADALGLKDRIRFLGKAQDIRPTLYACDLYVMCSHVEGQSIAAIEALASGRPILFADGPGLRDFNRWYDSLLYISPAPESIATGLRRFLAMAPQEREATAANNAAITVANFGIAAGVARYTDVYRGLK